MPPGQKLPPLSGIWPGASKLSTYIFAFLCYYLSELDRDGCRDRLHKLSRFDVFVDVRHFTSPEAFASYFR